MVSYILRKLGYGLLVLFGVITLVFFLFQGFGDPASIVMGQTSDPKTKQNIQKELMLIDESGKPIPIFNQYCYYINDLSPLAFHYSESIKERKIKGFFIGGKIKFGLQIPYLRKSYQTKREVGTVLMQALPGTILLSLAAMLIAVAIGIPLGVLAAVKKNTLWDSGAVFSSILGISAPSFFMGIVMVYLFGFVLNNYTGLSIAGSWYFIDHSGNKAWSVENLILPAITLGIRPLAIITQLTRSSMLDVLDQDYIRTAYAKGLQKSTVVFKHALKNALNPVITAITGWFAELLAGAFFVEYIFGWQGIGKVTVDALSKLDYPIVMGSVLASALFFIVMNIFADLIYGWIDRRVSVA